MDVVGGEGGAGGFEGGGGDAGGGAEGDFEGGVGGVVEHEVDAGGAEDVVYFVVDGDGGHVAVAEGEAGEFGGDEHGGFDMDVGIDEAGEEGERCWALPHFPPYCFCDGFDAAVFEGKWVAG